MHFWSELWMFGKWLSRPLHVLAPIGALWIFTESINILNIYATTIVPWTVIWLDLTFLWSGSRRRAGKSKICDVDLTTFQRLIILHWKFLTPYFEERGNYSSKWDISNIECLQIFFFFMNHHCSVFNTFKISSIYSILFWGTWQGGTVLVAWGLSSMADKGGLVILLAWSLQVGGVKKKHRKKEKMKRTKEGTIWVGCNVFFVSLKVYEKDNRRF